MTGPIPTYTLTGPQTEIYVGNCIEVLDGLYDSGVRPDLIFADPPFNIGQGYAGYDDARPIPEYEAFMYSWLRVCAAILGRHGSLWVNIPDELAAECVVYLKSLGLKMVNWCVWHYRFGQCNDSRFIRSKTHVLYFARSVGTSQFGTHRTWNPDAILVPSDRAVKYGDRRTLKSKRPGKRVPLDVWYGKGLGRIQGNNRERWNPDIHPNQIPEAYMQRIIAACSNEGDLALDPFLGSGGSCVVARAMSRRSIGIEISEALADSAFARIKKGIVR